MAVVDSRGNRRVAAHLFRGVDVFGLEENAQVHLHLDMHDAPLPAAYVGLLDDHPAALVELAQDAPGVVCVLLQMALQARNALLGGVDPDFTGHGRERLRLQVGRDKIRVGPEAEFLHSVRGAGVLVKKRMGQHPQELQDDAAVLFLCFPAVLLLAGIVEQRIQPGLFLLVGGSVASACCSSA